MENSKIIGHNIRELRKFHGDTQKTLGDYLYMNSKEEKNSFDEQTIRNYEQGKRHPKTWVLSLIAERYHVSFNTISKSKINFKMVEKSIEILTTLTTESVFPLLEPSKENKGSYKLYIELKNIYNSILFDIDHGIQLLNEYSGDPIMDLFEEDDYAMSEDEVFFVMNLSSLLVAVVCTISISEKTSIILEEKVYNKNELIKIMKSMLSQKKEFQQIDTDMVDGIRENIFKILKTKGLNYDILEYYSVILYFMGLIGEDYFRSVEIGLEMMFNIRMLGNPYANQFCKLVGL